MTSIFLLSDPHFGHQNILGFTINGSGTKLRPGFASIEEHDELIVQNWNKVVRPQDHAYCLGDVVINKRHLPIIRRLNGHKRLVMGNHDIYPVEMYIEAGFEKVMAYRVLDGVIMSHVPIHEGSLGQFKLNIHGHLHAGLVRKGGVPDSRYVSVCVEQIDYTPVSFEEIKSKESAKSDKPPLSPVADTHAANKAANHRTGCGDNA